MNKRHQLVCATHEFQPRPGERESYRPIARMGHQQRASREVQP